MIYKPTKTKKMKIKNREEAIELLTQTYKDVEITDLNKSVEFKLDGIYYILVLATGSVYELHDTIINVNEKTSKIESTLQGNYLMFEPKKTKKLASEFAVQSTSFETYKKFKKDAELVGWLFNARINSFTKEISYNKKLYFRKMETGACRFHLTFSCCENAIIYNIDSPTGYKKALEHAKELTGYVGEKPIKTTKEDCSLFEEKINAGTIEWTELETPKVENLKLKFSIDKLNQLIDKYETQRDTLNEVCEESAKAEYGFNLHVKILRDLKKLKEQLK